MQRFGLEVASMAVALALALGTAGAAVAQEAEDDGVEVTRGADDLNAIAGTPAGEQPHVNTALVFTDLGGRETRVACRATGADGAEVGRAFARVPANGLRVILASDFSAGAAYAGSVTCRADGAMNGKALLVAPAGMTQIGGSRSYRIGGRLHFPVVATR